MSIGNRILFKIADAFICLKQTNNHQNYASGIARKSGINLSYLSKMFKVMSRIGLVSIKDGGRNKYVEITPKGDEVYNSLIIIKDGLRSR